MNTNFEMNYYGPRHRRHCTTGFTLIELLIVIAIIALLAAILFPVFARARENARRTSCQNNLKQIGMGIIQYTQDHDERYPSVWNGQTNQISANTLRYWPSAIFPYVKSKQVYRCPNEASTNAGSYLVNSYVGLLTSAVITDASTLLLATDGNNGISNSKRPSDATTDNGLNEDYSLYCQRYRVGNLDHGTPRHMGRNNFLYCDGHVKVSPTIREVQYWSAADLESAVPFSTYLSPTTNGIAGCTGWQ